MNPVLEALQFRHACKKFDPQRKIPRDDLATILECGRLSPSSFGMEPWKFIVVETPALREALRTACWGQPQVTDASDVIVIVGKTALLRPNSDYVKSMFARRDFPPEALAAYLERYAEHHEGEIDSVMNDYAWVSKQCYIALANMMSAAAAVSIDSCPIEGFGKTEVEQVLGLEATAEEAVVVVTFGYRLQEQTPRFRLDFEHVVDYR
jgi:nitroreductase